MQLRKAVIGLAGAVTLTLLAGGTALASSGPTPDNLPDGAAQFVQSGAVTSEYWWLNPDNRLEASQSASYFKAVYFSAEDADELVVNVGSTKGECLGWDQANGVFDVRKSAPCNSNLLFDMWQFGSNNAFSEAGTLYNWDRGQTAWYNGQNQYITVFTQSGSNILDKWQFIDEFQG